MTNFFHRVLLRKLRRRRPSTSKNEPPEPERRQSIFDTLPVELLLNIVTRLSGSATACFALTSHYALDLVGEQSFIDLRPGQKYAFDMPHFRMLLGRDMAGWDFCPGCKTLHPHFYTEGPGVPQQKKTEEKKWQARRFADKHICHERDQVYFHDGYFLTWRDVHLAMRHHQLGPGYGIPLSNLSVRHSKLFDLDWSWLPPKEVESSQSFEALIVDGDLCLDRTCKFTIPSSFKDRGHDEALHIHENETPSLRKRRGTAVRPQSLPTMLFPNPVHNSNITTFALCQHLRARLDRLRDPNFITLDSANYQLLQFHKHLQCTLAHAHDQLLDACERCRAAPSRCPVCDVEYRIGKEGPATIVVKARYNFGEGLTPGSFMWRRHRQHLTAWYLNQDKGAESPGQDASMESQRWREAHSASRAYEVLNGQAFRRDEARAADHPCQAES